MLSQPFWGLFLIGLNKQWRNDIPTMCVTKSGVNYGLCIGPDFWDTLTEPNWKKALLCHEAIHIGYFHLERHQEFPNDEIRAVAFD